MTPWWLFPAMFVLAAVMGYFAQSPAQGETAGFLAFVAVFGWLVWVISRAGPR